jgi:hypothetical protein
LPSYSTQQTDSISYGPSLKINVVSSASCSSAPVWSLYSFREIFDQARFSFSLSFTSRRSSSTDHGKPFLEERVRSASVISALVLACSDVGVGTSSRLEIRRRQTARTRTVVVPRPEGQRIEHK